MTITKITRRVYVVTGKYDTIAVTPFGRLTCANHDEGVAFAKSYVQSSK